jgi:hypothetical protein
MSHILALAAQIPPIVHAYQIRLINDDGPQIATVMARDYSDAWLAARELWPAGRIRAIARQVEWE